MRCFGRAFVLAGVLRPLDLMALRDDNLDALPRPIHFFFTAGCAAGRDAAFCLAMCALPFFVDREEASTKNGNCRWPERQFVEWAKARLRPPSLARARRWACVALPTLRTRRAEARKSEGGSMQLENPVHRPQLGRLDQPRMRHGDREQRSLELFLPESEEILQRREFRKQIVILPDVSLQQRRVIRHPIENLRRRQTVTQHLFPEVFGNNPNPRDHANLHLRSAFVVVALPSHPGGDALT